MCLDVNFFFKVVLSKLWESFENSVSSSLLRDPSLLSSDSAASLLLASRPLKVLTDWNLVSIHYIPYFLFLSLIFFILLHYHLEELLTLVFWLMNLCSLTVCIMLFRGTAEIFICMNRFFVFMLFFILARSSFISKGSTCHFLTRCNLIVPLTAFPWVNIFPLAGVASSPTARQFRILLSPLYMKNPAVLSCRLLRDGRGPGGSCGPSFSERLPKALMPWLHHLGSLPFTPPSWVSLNMQDTVQCLDLSFSTLQMVSLAAWPRRVPGV